MRGRRESFFRKFTNVGFDDTKPVNQANKPHVVRKILHGDENEDGSFSERNVSNVTTLRKSTKEENNIMAPEQTSAGSRTETETLTNPDRHDPYFSLSSSHTNHPQLEEQSSHSSVSQPIDNVQVDTLMKSCNHSTQQDNVPLESIISQEQQSSSHPSFSRLGDQAEFVFCCVGFDDTLPEKELSNPHVVTQTLHRDEDEDDSFSERNVCTVTTLRKPTIEEYIIMAPEQISAGSRTETETLTNPDRHDPYFSLSSSHTNHPQLAEDNSHTSFSQPMDNVQIDKLISSCNQLTQQDGIEIEIIISQEEPSSPDTSFSQSGVRAETETLINNTDRDNFSLSSSHNNQPQLEEHTSSSSFSQPTDIVQVDPLINSCNNSPQQDYVPLETVKSQEQQLLPHSSSSQTDDRAETETISPGPGGQSPHLRLSKGKEPKRQLIYKHIDFLSDDEDFICSSSSSQESSETGEGSSKNNSGKKKKKKTAKNAKKITQKRNANEKNDTESPKKKVKKLNKAKVRAELRNSGQSYVTKTGKVSEEKKVQANPCTPSNCHNECYNISSEKRKAVFEHFWSLNREKQKDWLVGNAKKEVAKRKRSKDENSRRQYSFSYYINEGEGKRQICLRFLLCTLDMKQKTVYNTISNAAFGSAKEDSRGKNVPANKTSEKDMEETKNYIKALPYLPSHYCRKNSKRVYLPQEFRSLANLYKIYRESKSQENHPFVGEKTFQKIFHEYNIGFHVPRKDKCSKCVRFEKEVESDEKLRHLKDKQETYERFQVHQNIQDSNILCVSFDLQKVLNTPHGQSMLLYYSRKITVYNLCFYESRTREAYCYTWNETEGKRGANEICSILEKYIKVVDDRESVKHLLLYCDSCPGQNKNRTVLACIQTCLQKCNNLSSIQINYLLPGHTYMPVDSVHSVIERSVTNTIIWAPSQWGTVFTLARKNPKPYNTVNLTHTDFKGWDAIADRFFKGNLVGKISKVRVATFKKSDPDKASVKYTMAADVAEADDLTVNGKHKSVLKRVYSTRLPISKKKYDDLWKLCTTKVIPEEFQVEYKNLPCIANLQDRLPDTDDEDDIDED